MPQSEALVRKSVIMTARRFPNVEEVIIMVEGKEYDGDK